MTTYNGHRSWNAWNVALWISNEEPTYNFAMDCINSSRVDGLGRERSKAEQIRHATRKMYATLKGSKTPDGATFNALSIRECLSSFME